MKPCLLLLALALGWCVPAQAQLDINTRTTAWNDSLWFVIDTTEPGTSTLFDFSDFSDDRFDATGDGVEELITLEHNGGDVPVSLHVTDLTTETEVLTVDLTEIRRSLIAHEGFSLSEAGAMRFVGFAQWTNGTTDLPRVALFAANGAPIIFDPANQSVIALAPSEWRMLGITDLDGDGWLDMVLGNKMNRVVEVHISRFSPGFSM